MAAKGQIVVHILSDPIQYKPNQPRDKETAKRIRTHIAGNLKRKKLQVLLNPIPFPTVTSIVESRLLSPEAPIQIASNFCTCIVLKTITSSKEDAKSKALQKQRAIADSYKLCQRCHKTRFLDLSWLGQLKTARQRVPSVTPFLESEFDPFESLPELSHYKQTPQAKRLMNEFKAHRKYSNATEAVKKGTDNFNTSGCVLALRMLEKRGIVCSSKRPSSVHGFTLR